MITENRGFKITTHLRNCKDLTIFLFLKQIIFHQYICKWMLRAISSLMIKSISNTFWFILKISRMRNDFFIWKNRNKLLCVIKFASIRKLLFSFKIALTQIYSLYAYMFINSMASRIYAEAHLQNVQRCLSLWIYLRW